jgi:predicted DNA-binding transcriptional regulator AlpA
LGDIVTRKERLIGFREIGEVLGVGRTSAARYTKRENFPEPVAELASGPVWNRDEVTAWGKANLPLRAGRPRKS